ncbi:SDR family oxidoreductase [Kutzneria sp. CA-103260]|uniref:SDR family oxidoreductase n=1 Tax=Kutzneria sp. CA-103260 TaxID=2802641 RepID=UPI001BA85219|nr:SDR family oxidoreductase [Kutzneria sp. CA-103260]QUQ64346.1 3-oxoacyl-ACP reductase [Kutzneria sp. CA-103260]
MTAIVFGGSGGIGTRVAHRLALAGHDVVVGFVQDTAAAGKVAGEIEETGARAITVRGDVADPREVEETFDAAEQNFGGVDVVVVCPGAHAAKRGPLAGVDEASFARVVDVNLRGAVNVLRLAATQVRAGGSIVTLSSSAAALGVPGQALYNACKIAVESLTRELARELAGREVTVNSVAPGPTATELFLRNRSNEEIEALAKQVPLGRIGHPMDIADVIAFLTGPQGRWVNGQVIRANGGLV